MEVFALGHQFVEGALLFKPAVLHDEDAVVSLHELLIERVRDDDPCDVLNIKDEDGDVVYSTVVYSSETQVVLPSTLSGDYEIQLVTGNWCFWGYIEL